MKKIIQTTYLLIFLLIIASCGSKKTDNLLDNNKKINYLHPEVRVVNYDSIEKISVKGKIVKAQSPEVVSYTGSYQLTVKKPITNTNTGQTTIYTPGVGNTPLPKTFTVPTSGFTVQHGDTVVAAISTKVVQPVPTHASAMKYKDNSTNDIQYLDLEQGLYSSYIFSMIQDKRGNFWFGTWGIGLSKYDGAEFTHFTEREGIPNNYIYSIMEDSKGNLWLGSERGGVCKYDGKTFTTYKGIRALKDHIVKVIMEDKTGNIWFATEGGGVCVYDGKIFTVYTTNEGLSSNITKTLLEDNEGNIWIGTDGAGVNKFDGKSFTHYTTANGLSNNQIWSLAQDKKGNIWIGTNNGVCRFDGKTSSVYTTKQGLKDNIILKLIVDKAGDLWLGTEYGGVSKLMISNLAVKDTFAIYHFAQAEGLSFNNIWSMTEDNSGNIWVGTYGGGVNKLNLSSTDGGIASFTNITQTQGLSGNLIPAIIESSDGNYWIGMDGGGVNKFDGEKLYRYDSKHGLVNNSVLTVIEDQNKKIWIGTKEGICRFDGKQFLWITETEGLSENYVNALLEDKSGNIWVGTNGGGVCKLVSTPNKGGADLHFEKFTTQNGLGNNFIRSILEDSKGNMWFGTENGVSKLDKSGKTFTNYTVADGLRHNFVWCMTEDHYGNIWLGTGSDVSKIVVGGIENSDSTFIVNYTDEDGLLTNHVWSIVEDSDGNVWLGTDYGLGRLSPRMIDSTKLDNGKIIENVTYDYTTYITDDGLKGLDFWYNCVCIDKKNQIWWGTSKGISMLNLNYLRKNVMPPSVHLKSIDLVQSFIDYRALSEDLKAGESRSVGEGNISLNAMQFTDVEPFYNYPLNLVLPHYLHHITFNYVAVDWAAYHKIQYQYILEGLDNEWSILTKETKAEYRNLPHGSYTFKVKAIGIAKEWSQTYEYHFKIRPPWWLTWWAKTLWILLVVSSLYIFYQVRVSALKHQAQVLEEKVRVRTAQLNEANEELKATNDALNETLETVNKQKREIEHQKDKIQEAHQNIQDSILYAKRIQNAILPLPSSLSEIFPEHFVLYRPKEIVSGDFYYADILGDYAVVVAADCTGHGVPGAFMSMLGTAFLNEIVHKMTDFSAAGILEELRRKVKTSLHQTGKVLETRDGMDISLCIVDIRNRKMQFAGAYNPLYLIRNGELQQIKADRQPIAIYIKEHPFTNNEIELIDGDVFYLFSDGYADQDGGPDGKKFMAKRFMSLLTDIHQKPLDEQREILDQAIENWKGNKEQMDDMLVMGFKV